MAKIQYHTNEAELQVLASRMGEPVTLCYGRHLVGGAPAFQDQQTDGSTILLVALGDGEWDSIEYLWVNGKPVDITDTTKVHFHPGIDGEVGTESTPGTRNQKICSLFPAGFTQTTFSRSAYVALHLAADPAAPSAEFDVRGIYKTRRVRLFDAAGNQTYYQYSANPAWQFLDAFISLYLKPRALVGAELTAGEKARIDFVAFVQAAADCDADIGGGVKRFESHVAFMQKTTLATIYETIMSLCRGYVMEEGGKLGLYVDKARSSIFTLTGDMIRDASFEIPAKDLRQVCNQVTLKIRDIDSGAADHSKDFAPFTAIHNEQAHQDMVGRVIGREMDLGANTKERSERLAIYWMKRSLLPEQAQLLVTMDAGHLLPGDVITAPQDHNFSATRDWEVMEATDEPVGDQDGHIPASAFLRELILQEYDPTIFSDTAETQQETEETNIPGGHPPPASNANLIANGDMEAWSHFIIASGQTVGLPDLWSYIVGGSTEDGYATRWPGLEGTYALALHIGDAHGPPSTQYMRCWAYPAGIWPTATYYFSILAKANPAISAGFRLRLLLRDASLAGACYVELLNRVALGTTVQKFESRLVMPKSGDSTMQTGKWGTLPIVGTLNYDPVYLFVEPANYQPNISSTVMIDSATLKCTGETSNQPGSVAVRPTSNMLTATDAGASATVNVAGFDLRVSGQADVAYSAGSISSLAFNTLYFIYCDDPTLRGGTQTYNATVTKEEALNGVGRIFLGSIRTPVAAAPATVGNNDGGVGAQFGLNFSLLANQYTQYGNPVTDPTKAFDGVLSSNAFLRGDVSSDSTLRIFGFPNSPLPVGQAKLRIYSKHTHTGTPQTGIIRYSQDGGASWMDVRNTTADWDASTAPDDVTLTTAVLASVMVEAYVDSATGTDINNIRLYEAPIVVTS